MSVEQFEATLCGRLEAIRLDRNITQAELDRDTGVSLHTIRRLEMGEGTSPVTFRHI